MRHTFSVVLLTGAMLGAGATNTVADSNVLFIFDASGSMWGQVDRVAKIETAKDVLTSLLADLPPETNVGLMAYGHRSETACDDVELIAAIGGQPPELIADVEGLTPKGKTPIAVALADSAAAFKGLEEGNNSVVLISDGIESCDGDPCAVSADLAKLDINVRVHVVGFDVDEETRQQLECIAERGNGTYFNAVDSAGLALAIAEVRDVVRVAQNPPAVEPEPEPAPVASKEVFFDDFDGTELGESWEIINPNADAYIVENGELLILASKAGTFADNTVENVFKLNVPLPQGDWILSAKFRVQYQTQRETPLFGIFADKDAYILAGPTMIGRCCSYTEVFLNNTKMSNGEITSFSQQLQPNGPALNEGFAEWQETLSPHYITLTKTGRNYSFSMKLGDGEAAVWTELAVLTSLRPFGAPVIMLNQSEDTGGESLMFVDWVKVETP